VIVSAVIPFPNIYWWLQVAEADKVAFDLAEHFEKMTYRNKYFITGANGGIQLSIPLKKGRGQRTPMGDVAIDNSQRWQVQHWRTLVSVYKRSAYFEHYEPLLLPLFEQEYGELSDFNLASVQWLKKQLGLKFEEEMVTVYKHSYEEGDTDMRNALKPGMEHTAIEGIEPYYQLFSDRNGFLPNLSMLDLLFAEGPHAMQWAKNNRTLIKGWEAKK